MKRLRLHRSEDNAPTDVPELAFDDTGAAAENTGGFFLNSIDDRVAVGINSTTSDILETDNIVEDSDSDTFMGEYFTTDVTDVTDITDLSESEEVSDSPQESLHSLDSGYEQGIVFENCPLSVATSTLLIKKFQMRHNLTKDGLTDLLHLLRLHFPSPNSCPTSLYHFNNELPVLRDPLEFTYYCSKCLQEISNKQETICPNSSCQNSLTSERGALSSFIEVPLEPQLMTILQSEYNVRGRFLL